MLPAIEVSLLKGGDCTMPIRNIDQVVDDRGQVQLPGPRPAKFAFQYVQASWVWLLVRLWVGWQWLEAAWSKLNNPAWTDGSGQAIKGFWERALGVTPAGQPVIAFDWYRGFIQMLVDHHAEGWFSKLIIAGELTVGMALILGAFVGVAAAGGLLMSESYLLAGTASISPLLALFEILLIFAWKTAGYLGLDRYLLPALAPRWDRHVAVVQPERRATRSREDGYARDQYAPRDERDRRPVLTGKDPRRS
jgi:thiosulfate dehydrogenase [quinone] large subunit